MKTKTKRKPFKCDECRKITYLSEADIWDKVIRCVHCAEILMDNRTPSRKPINLQPDPPSMEFNTSWK